jgi:hypothetical protein
LIVSAGPRLKDAPEAEDGRLSIDLFLYGPGLAGELNLQRKIIKLGTYKNWRLDGEFIREDPERFCVLVPGNHVVIEFIGSIVPSQARALFVAAAVPEDSLFHTVLAAFLQTPGPSMRAISGEDLASLIHDAALSGEHPANEFILDAALEDAAQSGQEGIQRLLQRRSGRALSAGDLKRAKAQAEQDGQRGEEFINGHLGDRQRRGEITGFEWASAENPVSPFDFVVSEATGKARLDVKSTRGEFGRRIHISLSELASMAREGGTYDLYRVYEMTGDRAKLRVARNMREFARNILNGLAALPYSTEVDSVSVPPSEIEFAREEISLTLTPEAE